MFEGVGVALAYLGFLVVESFLRFVEEGRSYGLVFRREGREYLAVCSGVLGLVDGVRGAEGVDLGLFFWCGVTDDRGASV